jgi:serine/threonine protein kinase
MQSIPVQSWIFEHESVIRIGRSTDNHVILYSAVVSRHHVEIRKEATGWQIVNLGANGTYLEGKRISQVPVQDGVIIRLARSGPNVQIHLTAQSSGNLRAATATDSTNTVPPPAGLDATAQVPTENAPVSPDSEQTDLPASPSKDDAGGMNGVLRSQSAKPENPTPDQAIPAHLQTVSQDVSLLADGPTDGYALSPCCHKYVGGSSLFCLDCGKPLTVLSTIAGYHILKLLGQDSLGNSQLAWHNGKTFILHTLHPDWIQQPESVEAFEQDAKQLLLLQHPALPNIVDFFIAADKPYLVVESTYGPSLQQLVERDGCIPLDRAIGWILNLCDLLDYLHQQTPPVLHQNLRPDLLIYHPSTAPQDIVVTGFTPGQVLKTAIQQGPPDYIAPEQQQGVVSPQTDLYALAPILVFLLTAKSPAVFYAQREQGFRFYPEYVPGISSDLAAVLRRLTHPNPEERHASAAELAAALKTIRVSG